MQYYNIYIIFSEAATRSVLKTPVPESQACNFIKKETMAQVFSCEFCEIFESTIFKEHLRATTSQHGTSNRVQNC